MTLEELVCNYLQDAKNGDEIAFQFIHYYSYPFIVKHLRNKWPTLLDVNIEVIAEKALNEVWKSLPNYENNRPFQPWLLTIVDRAASRYSRNNVNAYSLTQEDEKNISDKTLPTPEELYMRREVLETVHKVLSELKGNRRNVLILRFFLDCDYNEIVNRLSLSSKEAARQLCYNALRESRKILDRQRKFKKNIQVQN